MNIEPAFIETVHRIYQAALAYRYTLNVTPHSHLLKRETRMQINRLKKPEHDLDRMIRALQALPYTVFGLRCGRNSEPYLVGVTKPVYVVQYAEDGSSYPACLGGYVVGVPAQAVIHEQLENFHFVPCRNLRTSNRHFHHRADGLENNPLNQPTETCWASMAPLMLNALHCVDIPSVFETAFLFLERIDHSSVLCYPSHGEKVSIEEYAHHFGIPKHLAVLKLYEDINALF